MTSTRGLLIDFPRTTKRYTLIPMRAFVQIPGIAERLRPRDGCASARTSQWRVAVYVGFLGALALFALALPLPREHIAHGDDLIYEDIAQSPFGTHTFPFGYRIGLPLLVHILPLSSPRAFMLLAIVFTAGATMFAYLLMRFWSTPPLLAAFLSVAMAASPPFLLVVLRDGRNTDIATVFFLMASTYFAARRLYWPLAVTLMLGVIVREAALFIIPLAYALWATKPLDLQAARRTVTVAAGAVCVYVGLHLSLTTIGKAQVPGYGHDAFLAERFHVVSMALRSPWGQARHLFTIYGPLWLVAPFALWMMPFARRGLVLVGLSLVAMTFALDWGRMILLAAPVFYPASAYVLSKHRRIWRPVAISLVALSLGYAGYMAHSGVRTGIVSVGPPPYPVK
ncbi:MAG: hypothetical protein ACYDHN_15035 [Solirubrobacteraceae bacterium]